MPSSVPLQKIVRRAAGAALLIALPTAAQGFAARVPVALATDAALTCPNILSEVYFRNDELELLQNAMDKIEVTPSAKTEAIGAAMLAVGVLAMALPVPPPGLSMAFGAGTQAHVESFSNDFKKAYAPLQTQFDFALDRMDYLHGLYQRRCVGGKK